MADVKARRAAHIKANRERIFKQYGLTSDEDIIAILNAEIRLRSCQSCTGWVCPNAEHFPTITVTGGKLNISYGRCKFAQRQRRERLGAMMELAKIPQRYFGKTFADYDVDRNNEAAVTYAKNILKTRRGAYLYGERGTGKTFLASIIAQEFLRAGKTVVFEKVTGLLGEIRDTFNGRGKFSEAQIMDAASKADLLVLDDMGMEKPTMFAGATLCSIIDARYDRPRLTTIITSNEPIETVCNGLDHAVDGKNCNGSRIHDRCMEICKPILLNGVSRRR